MGFSRGFFDSPVSRHAQYGLTCTHIFPKFQQSSSMDINVCVTQYVSDLWPSILILWPLNLVFWDFHSSCFCCYGLTYIHNIYYTIIISLVNRIDNKHNKSTKYIVLSQLAEHSDLIDLKWSILWLTGSRLYIPNVALCVYIWC